MELSELLIATKFIKNSKLFLLGMGFSALIPFFDTRLIERFLPVICFVFTLMLLLIYLRDFPNLRVEHIGFVCTFLLLIAFSMTSLVYMRNMFGYSVGLYAVLVTLCAAWMSDTGAYFVGRAFGKHLLAPQISPKKTVEGLFGGIVIAMASQMLVGLLFMQYAAFIGRPIHINFWLLLIVSPILSLLSVVGDLSASAIKRQFGIKDFGKSCRDTGERLTALTACCLSRRLSLTCLYTSRSPISLREADIERKQSSFWLDRSIGFRPLRWSENIAAAFWDLRGEQRCAARAPGQKIFAAPCGRCKPGAVFCVENRAGRHAD
jgi:phosphatidate cytidylyltransferase